MEKRILRKRAEVVAALRAAMQSYDGDPGPGTWSIQDVEDLHFEPGPKPVELTYVWPDADLPKDQHSDAPWTLWGGDYFLQMAGVTSHRSYGFPDSLKNVHHCGIVDVLD
jgi:hypothetical protein